MFEFDQEETFPRREERVLRFWEERKFFEKSIENRRKGPLFTFYDGPPFATGLPHYGHILAGTIKDVVPRYKTMKGFCVPRRFGWDCHGLPIENEIEKAEGLSRVRLRLRRSGSRTSMKSAVRIVLRYTANGKRRSTGWVDGSILITPIGRWILAFMESVWWVFQQLYDKGLVYEGSR